MLAPRLLATLLIVIAIAPAQQAYDFRLDGEAAEVHFVAVEGPRGRPSPGDVAWVGGFEFVLDAPGRAQLVHREHDVHRIDGESDTCIGLFVRAPERFLSLSRDDLQQLRSIEFSHWLPEFAAQLAKADLERCFVRFTMFAALQDLTELPVGLRYLDVQHCGVQNLDGIERLRELRFLRVPGKETVKSIAPIAPLRKLRYLELDMTGVRDLTPLDGHPTLRGLQAAHAPLELLPRRQLPALVDLIAFDSGCPSTEVARFQALQPQTWIATTRRTVLLDRVRGTVRVRLRTGSTCHPSDDDRELASIDDPAQIAALIGLLHLREEHAPYRWVRTCEEHTLEFFAADGRQLVELGVFDAGMLRSFRIWGLAPATVATEARAALRAWLAKRGAKTKR